MKHHRDDLLGALREEFRFGISDRGVVVDLAWSDDRPLLTFRWAQDPHVFGILLDLPDPDADSLEEWTRETFFELFEELDAGLLHRSVRAAVDDHIRLTGSELPVDRRFDTREMDRETDGWWLQEQGFDTSLAQARHDEERFLAWLIAYVDNSRGEPVVAQAVACWDQRPAAVLELVDAAPHTPVTAVLDLVRVACSLCAEAGAVRVTTQAAVPELELLGFRTRPDGVREIDTAFLDVDVDGLEQLYGSVRTRLPRELLRGRRSWRDRVKRRLFTRTFAG